MATLKSLATALAFASIGFTLTAAAHDHVDNDHGTETSAEHQKPATDAGGTPGQRGVGGSVEVPGARPGAETTTPYDDLGDDVEEPRDDRELNEHTRDRDDE